MRWVFYIGFVFSFYSCGPRIYTYKFSMDESTKPRKLLFENDTVSFSFKFSYEGFMVELTNKFDSVIEIKWDEIKMTVDNVERKTQYIMVNEERKLYIYQPPDRIPPNGKVTDLITYSDHIYYTTEDGEEIINIKDMYPRKTKNKVRDSVEHLKGQRIKFLFPANINKVPSSWTFNILLKEIKSTRRYSAAETALGILSLIHF